MKSEVWHAWVARVARPKLFAPIGEVSHGYEKFIHRENLTLFKKRLAASRSDAEREVPLKLLADEEARSLRRKMAYSSRVDLHQKSAAREALSTGRARRRLEW